MRCDSLESCLSSEVTEILPHIHSLPWIVLSLVCLASQQSLKLTEAQRSCLKHPLRASSCAQQNGKVFEFVASDCNEGNGVHTA